MRYAGGYDWWSPNGHAAGIYTRVSSLAVSNTTITNCLNQGVWIRPGLTPTLTNNTLSTNSGWAVLCEDVNCTAGVLRGNSAAGNGVNGIRVYYYLTSSATWEDTIPFVLDPWVQVQPGVTLTIRPGVVVKGNTAGGRLAVYGTLNADASAGAAIHFTAITDDSVGGDTNGDGTATVPGRGSWGGIGFINWTPLPSGTLKNVDVRYAGGFDWLGPYLHIAGVYTQISGLTLAGSTIRDNNNHGLYVQGSQKPTVTGNSFTGNSGYAIWCDDVDTTRGVFQGNSASGNGTNGIRVYSYLDGAATWEDALPFVIDAWIDVYTGATLTVKPGVIVKVAPGSGNKIQVDGTLHAGEAGQARVYVTSLKDDSVGGDTNGDGTATVPARGDWGGIGFSGGASTTR